MADNFECALNKTSENFSKVIEKIKESGNHVWSDCEFYPVENQNHPTLDCIDKYSGIDYIACKNGNVVGVSSRIQVGEDYKTFTVRKERITGAKTEFEKRKEQLGNTLCATHHLQAYIKDGEVLSVGIARFDEIIDFIEDGYAKENITGYDQIGQAKFYICEWDKMKEKGCRITVI